MPVYEVNLPEPVLDEIEHYFHEIAKDSLDNALNWYAEIRAKIETLDQFPERCPYADENRFHEYEIRNLIFGMYRILFRIKGHTVQILHVKHGRMERRPLE